MANTAKRVTYAALLALLLIFIFFMSSQDGESSGGFSGLLMLSLNDFFYSADIGLRFTEFFIRKAAHFIQYAALGALLCLNFSSWMKIDRRTMAWPLLAGLTVGLLDEFVQTFVPGRAGTVEDVLLDFSGVLFGFFLLYFARCLVVRYKSKGVSR